MDNKFSSDNGLGISIVSDIYNKKLQQKKLKQEAEKLIAEQEQYAMHQRMLDALVSIRKALREVCSVDLGENFSFKLIGDDWWGWPRLTLSITTPAGVTDEAPKLMVNVYDRNESGAIVFVVGDEGNERTLSLTSDHSLAQVPAFLRTCVREYLDLATEYVLNTENYTSGDSVEKSLEDQDILAMSQPKVQASQTETEIQETFVHADLEGISFIETVDDHDDNDLPAFGDLSFTADPEESL
jgi:hypothetical protein